MNSTWSWLMRPSLKVSDRAVLIPSTATPGSSTNGHRRLVDEAAIARERRQEAAQHVVERNVVVAGHAEHFVARCLQPLEELAGLAELLGPRALGEVAADDDEVGLQLVDTPLDGLDQPLVMGAEMQVGKMDEAGMRFNDVTLNCFSARSCARAVSVRTFSLLDGRQKFRNSSSFTSTPKPSARFCSMKFGMSARGTRWTLMSSFSSPPPSPILRTPCARTSVKPSDSIPGDA